MRRVTNEGCTILAISVLIKIRFVSPHQALRASFPLGGEAMGRTVFGTGNCSIQDPSLMLGMTRMALFSEILRLALLAQDDRGGDPSTRVAEMVEEIGQKMTKIK